MTGDDVGSWIKKQFEGWTPAHALLDAGLAFVLLGVAKLAYQTRLWDLVLLVPGIILAIVGGTGLWVRRGATPLGKQRAIALGVIKAKICEHITNAAKIDSVEAFKQWTEGIKTLIEYGMTTTTYSCEFQSASTMTGDDWIIPKARAIGYLTQLEARIRERHIRDD